MRARHRLSKLRLRQGIVYCDGNTWTDKDARLLCPQRFDIVATRLAFESDYDAVLTVGARRDRLDDVILEMAGDSEFMPIVRRLSCLCGVSTLTRVRAGCLNRLLAPVHRQQHRFLPRVGAQ